MTTPAPAGVIQSNGGTSFGASVLVNQVAPGAPAPLLSATAAARHTVDSVVLRVRVTDSDVDAAGFVSGGVPYKFDSVEVLCDFDASRGTALAGDDMQLFALPQHAQLFTVDGRALSWGSVVTRLLADGYELTVTLPLVNLRTNGAKQTQTGAPPVGESIGFDVVVNNRAASMPQRDQVFFVYGVAHHRSPNTWGRLTFASAPPPPLPTPPTPVPTTAALSNYERQLQLILANPFRNTNNDNRPFSKTPSTALPKEQLYSPWQDYGRYLEGLDKVRKQKKKTK